MLEIAGKSQMEYDRKLNDQIPMAQFCHLVHPIPPPWRHPSFFFLFYCINALETDKICVAYLYGRGETGSGNKTTCLTII